MAAPQYFDTFDIPLSASAAIGRYLRVKVESDGDIALADAADARTGVTLREAFAAGDEVAVRLPTAPSAVYTTDATFAIGDSVYGEASGEVGTTNTNERIGIALTATSGGANELILVAHSQPGA